MAYSREEIDRLVKWWNNGQQLVEHEKQKSSLPAPKYREVPSLQSKREERAMNNEMQSLAQANDRMTSQKSVRNTPIQPQKFGSQKKTDNELKPLTKFGNNNNSGKISDNKPSEFGEKIKNASKLNTTKNVNTRNLDYEASKYFDFSKNPKQNIASEKQFIKDMTNNYGYSEKDVKAYLKDYKANKGAISDTKTDVDKFLNPSYKMTKYEERLAKDTLNNYFKENPKANQLLHSNNPNIASRIRSEMTPEEQNEFEKMSTLMNKTSDLSAYTYGLLNIMPFGNTLMDKMGEVMGVDPEHNYSAQERNVKTQSPLAYLGGDATSKMAAYSVLGKALESIPALGQATNEVGEAMAFGNKAMGDAIGGVLRGNIADIALDTIPTEIENYQNGMRGGELVKDTIGNMLLNTVFNAGGEALSQAPQLLKSLKNTNAEDVLKNVDEVVAPRVNSIDEERLLQEARQNEWNALRKGNAERLEAERELAYQNRPRPNLIEEQASNVDEMENLRRALAEQEALNNAPQTPEVPRVGEEPSLIAEQPKVEDTPSGMDVPHELAERYAMAYSDFDDYGAIDNYAEMDGFVEQMADDIANGRDLSEYISTLEDSIEDAPDDRIKANMEAILSDLQKLNTNAVNKNDAVTNTVNKSIVDANESKNRAYQRYNDLRKHIDNKRLSNVKFDNDADAKAYDAARKDLFRAVSEYSNAIETAKSDMDIANAARRVDEASRVLNEAGKKGYVNNKANQIELRKIKKDFYEKTKGTVINIPAELRGEAGLKDKTMRMLNSELSTLGGNDHIKFSSKGGTPIDTVWNELVSASGNALDINTSNNADMVAQLLDYVDGLKVGGKGVERIPANTYDYAGDDLFDAISQMNNEASNRIKNSVIAEPIFGKEVSNNIDNVAKTNKVIASDEGLNPKTIVDDDVNEIVDGSNALKTEPKYNIVESEEPDIPVNPNSAITETPMKERGLSTHIRGEGKMQMEDLPEEVAASFKEDPDLYVQLKNKDTKAKAEEIYANSPNPEQSFRNMLERHDPAAIPLGYKLSKDFAAQGNYDMATQILRDMDEALTNAGQFTQAAVINMTKDDPLVAMKWAQREIDSMNRAGKEAFGNKWKNFKLTDDEIKAFNNIKPGDEDALKELYDQIGTRLGKEYPVKLSDKLIELRRVGMLLNPRTHVRNFGANLPTLPMRWMSDRMEAVGQNIAHLFNPDLEVTQSIIGSGIKGRKLATEAFNSDKVQALLKGTNGKYDEGLKTSLMDNKQVFKGTALEKWLDKVSGDAFNKAAEVLNSSKRIDGGIQALNSKLYGKDGVQSTLETLRNTTYKLLDLGDSPFVRENFVERLGSYINAQGIKNIDDIPEEAIMTAYEEAMKATYKDNSWAVKMLSGMRGGLEKIPGVGKFVGQGAIPFLQAPGNIAARMVDYSPIRGTKGIADIISGATKNDVKQITKGIEEFSKGATGSAMILLGMKLKESGLLTGDYSSDPDQKAQQKRDGFRPFALHIGDKYFSYDWAQPFAEPMIIGTLLQETIEDSDKYDSDILKALGYESTTAGKVIGSLGTGAKASFNSWFNASPLQGLSDLLGGGNTKDSTVADNVLNTTVGDFAGSFIPSAVNATAKTMDTTQRNTYDPTNKFKTFLNQQQAKIPGLSKNLPIKYDTWGNEMKYADSNLESAAQRYLIPGEYGVDKHDEIDDEINRLFDDNGDNGVFAPYAPYKVNNEKLTNEQVSEYQKDMGTRNRELIEEFMDSDLYNELDDASRIDVIKGMYGASKAITERDLFDKDVSDNSSYKKAIEAYDKDGVDGLIEYYEQKNNTKKVKEELGSDSDYAMEIYNSGDKKLIKDYKEVQKISDKYGQGTVNEEELLTYEKYGEDALKQKYKYQQKADRLHVSNNETFRKLTDEGVPQNQIKDAYDAITSIKYGEDDLGRDKNLGFDETSYNVYRNYGKDGLEDLATIKGAGGNKDTFNAYILYSKASEINRKEIPHLDAKGFMQKVSYIENAYIKANPDKDAKPNGEVSMGELIAYMNQKGYDANTAQKYWDAFFNNGYKVSYTKKGKLHYTNPNKKKSKKK